MSETDSAAPSVFILYRQPDYEAFMNHPSYDGGPVPDEGEEWQLGVYRTRASAEAEQALWESRRKPDELIEFGVDEYQLGELHWLSGFFVDEAD